MKIIRDNGGVDPLCSGELYEVDISKQYGRMRFERLVRSQFDQFGFVMPIGVNLGEVFALWAPMNDPDSVIALHQAKQRQFGKRWGAFGDHGSLLGIAGLGVVPEAVVAAIGEGVFLNAFLRLHVYDTAVPPYALLGGTHQRLQMRNGLSAEIQAMFAEVSPTGLITSMNQSGLQPSIVTLASAREFVAKNHYVAILVNMPEHMRPPVEARGSYPIWYVPNSNQTTQPEVQLVRAGYGWESAACAMKEMGIDVLTESRTSVFV